MNKAALGQKRNGVSPVVKLRLIICAAVCVCAVMLKMHGGEVYEKVRSEYFDYVEKSVVTESIFIRGVSK